MSKIAMISTFRTQCGVGLYAEELAGELSKLVELKVFAETLSPPQTETEPLKGSEDVVYERCWNRRNDYYKLLCEKVVEYKPDVAHFQFVSGVHSHGDMSILAVARTLQNHGIKTVFEFHDIPPNVNPTWYRALLSKIITKNPVMTETIKQYTDKNIHEIPLGTPKIPNIAREVSGNFIVTQIGFYGIDKGMLGIIKAIPQMKDGPLKLKVVFAGGFHPLAASCHRPYVLECMKTAVKLGVADKIHFTNRVITEAEINSIAVTSNILILNQQSTYGASTSASAHRILTAKRPIIMSLSPKLSEFTSGVNCVKVAEEDIAGAVNNLRDDVAYAEQIAQGAYDYGMSTTFDKIAKRYVEEVY